MFWNTKYHINKRGKIEKCTSFFSKCPFQVHGTQEECQAHIDRELAEKARIEEEENAMYQKAMKAVSGEISRYFSDRIFRKILSSEEYKEIFYSFVGNDFGKPRGMYTHRLPKHGIERLPNPGVERLPSHSDDFRSHYRILTSIGNIEYEAISDLATLAEISQKYPDKMCRFKDTAYAQLKRTKIFYELAREMGIGDDKISFYGVDAYADPNMLKKVRRDINGEIDNLYLIAEDYGNFKDYFNEHITPVQAKVVDIKDDKIKLDNDFEFKNYGYNVKIKNPNYGTMLKMYSDRGQYLHFAKRLVFAVVESDKNYTTPLTKEEQNYSLVRQTDANTVVYENYTDPSTISDKTCDEYRDRTMTFVPNSIQYSVSIEDYVKTLNREFGKTELTSKSMRERYQPIFYGPFPKPFLGIPTLEKSTKEE